MCHSSYGGSARIALNSAAELLSRGHCVHLFTRTPPYLRPRSVGEMTCHTLYDISDSIEHPSSLKTSWPGHELDRMAEVIVRTVEDQGLDILHIHYAFPFIHIARSVKGRLKEMAPSIILTLHGTDVRGFEHYGADGSELSRALECCDFLTTVSASHAQLFASVSGRAHRPHVIPNFVDLSCFFPKPPCFKDSGPVIMHISNFRKVKNPCGVIDIFARLRARKDCSLWLVGDGEEMESVKAMVEDRGLNSDVRYFGLLPDVSNILKSADILVMSSVYESFCLTALEAMACGVPVLAPNIGGLPEVVVHGSTGFLYPAGDYASAAGSAMMLLDDPELYRGISANAVCRAQAFDQKKVVTLYEGLYSRLRPKALPAGDERAVRLKDAAFKRRQMK
jgi:L-malate glycosyltransferase